MYPWTIVDKAITGSKARRSGRISPLRLFLFLVFLLLPLFFFVTRGRAAQVTLEWSASTSSYVTGYNFHYGTASGDLSSTINVGNATTYTVTGLSAGTTYYFAVSAYDGTGAESADSAEVNYTVPPEAAASTPPNPDSGGGGGGGGGCFIATAAFGSYLHPYVKVLRSFRDACLLTNGPGRYFVRRYYAASPALAAMIRGSEAIKAAVRLLLVPLIGFSYLCLVVGAVPAVFLVLLSFGLLFWLGRTHFSALRNVPRRS